MLGGGMRQAGIIAAPGILALTKMVDRLAEDHANAKLLEQGLRKINGIKIKFPVMTNMVYIDISGLGWNGDDFREASAKLGWKTRGSGTSLRLCTHYGIEREDIAAFIKGITELVPKA
jgi:threonine aldolase